MLMVSFFTFSISGKLILIQYKKIVIVYKTDTFPEVPPMLSVKLYISKGMWNIFLSNIIVYHITYRTSKAKMPKMIRKETQFKNEYRY